ncbi:hypothetical protein MBLNU230_g3382t1 [Neophaeotheca triangularis]
MPPPRKLASLNKNGGRPPNRAKPKPPPAQSQKCCDEPDHETNDEGERYCKNCGEVIQAVSNIVSDVTFQEDSRGAAAVQGGFISENARHAHTMGAAGRRLGGGEHNNQAAIDSKGREELAKICPRLRIPERLVNIARTNWNLAASLGFGTGRKTEEVIAACLYAACRTDSENTVLLMDIAELVKVNVFRLGEVYKALVKALFLAEQPVSDQAIIQVEPLILKFCKKLEFGDTTMRIASDAIKILQRMKRDWIVPGRHPAGVCGACIVLAARMNGLRRSVREVVYVVKVADVTVTARMDEFKLTPAAALSANQFRDKGPRLKKTMDPPSMTAADERHEKLERLKRKRQAAEAEDGAVTISANGSQRSSPVASGALPTPDPSQQASQQPANKRTKKSPAATDANTCHGPTASSQDPLRVDDDGFAIPNIPASSIDPALTGGDEAQAPRRSQSADPPPTAEDDPPKRKRGRPRKDEAPPAPQITEDDLISIEQFENEVQRLLSDNDITQAASEQEVAKASEAAKLKSKEERARGAEATKARRQEAGIDWWKETPTEEYEDGQPPPVESITAEQLEAEFENDPEVRNCLLGPEEVQFKEKIWVANNEDWLRTQYEKALKAQIQKTDGPDKKRKGGKRKKRGKAGDGTLLQEAGEAGTPIESAADANNAMLKKHVGSNFSRYLDYDTLLGTYGKRGPSSQRSVSEAASSRAGTPARIDPATSKKPGERGSAAPDGAQPTPAPTQEQAAAGGEHNEEEAGQEDEEMENEEEYVSEGNSDGGMAEENEDWETAVSVAGGLMGDDPGFEEEY